MFIGHGQAECHALIVGHGRHRANDAREHSRIGLERGLGFVLDDDAGLGIGAGIRRGHVRSGIRIIERCVLRRLCNRDAETFGGDIELVAEIPRPIQQIALARGEVVVFGVDEWRCGHVFGLSVIPAHAGIQWACKGARNGCPPARA